MWEALKKIDQLKFRAPIQPGQSLVPKFTVLSKDTKIGRASRGPLQLDDSYWDRQPKFAWFTYVDEDNPNHKQIIDFNLENYLEEYDEAGRKTNKQLTNRYYDTQQELRLYDMSSVQTIEYLRNYVSEQGITVSVRDLNDMFPIVGGIVKRNSNFPQDRRLFQSMIRANLFDDYTRGWCHDDMPRLTGGMHRREGVIVDPITAFIKPPEKAYDASEPTTP